MAKIAATKPKLREAIPSIEGAPQGNERQPKAARRDPSIDQLHFGAARFEAVMLAAQQAGLLGEKSSRIGGRVSPALIEQAKRQTGIETDTDLIAFALATVALEDKFAEAFKTSRGKVDPEVKLGF